MTTVPLTVQEIGAQAKYDITRLADTGHPDSKQHQAIAAAAWRSMQWYPHPTSRNGPVIPRPSRGDLEEVVAASDQIVYNREGLRRCTQRDAIESLPAGSIQWIGHSQLVAQNTACILLPDWNRH